MNKRKFLACLLFVIVCLMVTACSTTSKARHEQDQQAQFHGIDLSMEEIAHDGTSEIYSFEPFRKIDANSVLKLRFNVPQTPETLSGSDEWRAMNRILQEIDSLMKRYSELSQEAATMSVAENAETEAWHTKIKDFDKQFIAFTSMLYSPLMSTVISRDQINELFKKSADEDRSFFELLAEYIVHKRKELYDKAEQIAIDGDAYKVVVKGYLVPQIGEPQQLHIPGYDNIAARNFQPIDRMGLIPTEAEAKRLRAEYEGAKVVKSALDEISSNKSAIANNIKELVEKMNNQIKTLLEDSRLLWNDNNKEQIQYVLQELQKIDANQAKQLSDGLDEFKKDAQLIKQLDQKLVDISKKIKQRDALELLISVQRWQEDIKSVAQDIDKLINRVQAWPERSAQLIEFTASAAKKIKEVKQEELAQKADSIINGFMDNLKHTGTLLSKDLPNTLIAVNYFINNDFIKQGKDLLTVADILNPAEPGTIPRPLDNLEDALLDLRRSGITVGDTVQVDVGFIKTQSDTIPEKTIQYSGQAVLTGVHRQFSGDMIFARAVKGSGSHEFKPNVGVSAEWHYYDRSRPNGFVNWLDPGIGFHAANLDQSPDQTVELGAGTNLSLWGGLVRVGYGWNLSVTEDRPYFYVGFGLFGLLNQLNNMRELNDTRFK